MLFNLVLAALAFYAGMRLAGPIRSAAVTVIVLTVPLIWVFAFLGDGQGGSGAARGIYLLTIATYAGLYLLGWTRGHSILLGLALLVLVFWLVFEVGNHDQTVLPFQSTVQNGSGVGTTLGSSGSQSGLVQQPSDDTTTTSTTALIIGLAYLGVGAVLDRRKLAGAATPFIVVGAIATIIGALALGADESVFAGGLLAAISGGAVGLVGGLGTNRRGTTWIGVLFVVGGLLAIISDAAHSTLGFAGLAALVALVLGLGAVLTVHRLNEFTDGDDRAVAGSG